MNAEAAFLQAALPDPVILLHQKLLPYSLGAELLLRRLASPFLAETPYEPAKVREKLFTAVLICACSYDEAAAALSDPGLPAKFKAWRKLCGRFDAHGITLAFLRYLREGRTCPEFTRILQRGTLIRPGAPVLLSIWHVLLQLGYSRTEALACPFGLARWHYVAWHEARGTGRITNCKIDALRAAMLERGWEPQRN